MKNLIEKCDKLRDDILHHQRKTEELLQELRVILRDIEYHRQLSTTFIRNPINLIQKDEVH